MTDSTVINIDDTTDSTDSTNNNMSVTDKKKLYYKNYKIANRERYNTLKTCDICDGTYKPADVTHHRRSKMHERAVEKNNKNREIDELKKKIEELQTKILEYANELKIRSII